MKAYSLVNLNTYPTHLSLISFEAGLFKVLRNSTNSRDVDLNSAFAAIIKLKKKQNRKSTY